MGLTLVDDADIFIEDDVMIGPNVTICTGAHPVSPRLRAGGLQYNKPVRICAAGFTVTMCERDPVVAALLRERALLDAALAARPRKVVIKRPPKGPWLAGARPSHSIAGKAVRYDVIAPPTDALRRP